GTHDVWSDRDLTLKTTDARLALKGVGYRFSNSRLTISNKVEAIMRRQAVAEAAASAATTANTNDFLRVTADRLEYFVDSLTFQGHVRVIDQQGEVQCRTLKVKLA